MNVSPVAFLELKYRYFLVSFDQKIMMSLLPMGKCQMDFYQGFVVTAQIW